MHAIAGNARVTFANDKVAAPKARGHNHTDNADPNIVVIIAAATAVLAAVRHGALFSFVVAMVPASFEWERHLSGLHALVVVFYNTSSHQNKKRRGDP